MKSRGVFLVLFAALLASCTIDEGKEAATYRKVTAITSGSGPTTRPADEPLGLVEAMLLANDANERLAMEGEDYLQAIIDRKRALALFLPTADLIGSYGVNGDALVNPNGADFDLAAIGRINIFNGFRDVAQLRIADLTIEQRKLLLLGLQESLLIDVVRAYHDVLRLEEETRVLESTLQLQQQRVRDARGRQQAGAARILDVSQTEAQASATRVRLLNTRLAAHNARSAMALVTGLPHVDMPLIDEGLADTAPATIDEAVAAALAGRHDLAAAGKALAARRNDVEVAVGQYYPSLSVDLQYFFERQSNPQGGTWEGVLNANLPIFSAGRNRADVREAWSNYRKAVLFRSLLQRQIQSDVEVAWRNYMTSVDRIAELQTQFAAAEQARNQAEASFDAGLATNLERLVAQDQYLSARLQLTSEVYDRRVYASQLARATGGLRPLLEQAVVRRSPGAATQPAVAAGDTN